MQGGYDAKDDFLLNPVIIWRDLGIRIIVYDPDVCFILNLWWIMIARFPKVKMFQDSFDNMRKFNKGDNTHLALAFWTDKGINFVYFLNHSCPVFQEFPGRSICIADWLTWV